MSRWIVSALILVLAAMPSAAAAQTVTLKLGELLPDSNGKIVIVNGGDDPQLQIMTELKLLESGVAQDHLTESGLQVGGFNYWVFEDGTKLFYAPGLSVELQHNA